MNCLCELNEFCQVHNFESTIEYKVYFVTTEGCPECMDNYAVACADEQCNRCGNIAGRLYFDSPAEVTEYKQEN